MQVVVDNCCSPLTINSGAPEGSVLLQTPFLIFINDLLKSCTSCRIHSYAYDSNFHYSTCHSLLKQEFTESWGKTLPRLTFDKPLTCNCGRINLTVNASKTQFLHVSIQCSFPNNYLLILNNKYTAESFIFAYYSWSLFFCIS